MDNTEREQHDREKELAAEELQVDGQTQPLASEDAVGGEKAQIDKLEKEREEYLDGWKRAKADLINFRKEEARRLEQIVKFGNEELIVEFLTVLDSFDLALSNLDKEDTTYKGVFMIKSQLEDILKRRGLKRLSAEAGKPFDPATQEVVSEVESEKEAGTVLEELGSGYTLHDKVIRPVRVIVAKRLAGSK